MSWLAAGREGLDDNHAAAAAAARTRQHAGFVSGCGLGGLGRFRAGRDGEQLACPCDVGGAIAVGEQSVVADAVQALGQHVRQEAANELVGWQRDGVIAARSLDPVILPLERDAGLVGSDQPAIGDGDAVGVARQVGEHGLRPGERLLGIDDPLDLAQRCEEGSEGSRLGQGGAVAEEREAWRPGEQRGVCSETIAGIGGREPVPAERSPGGTTPSTCYQGRCRRLGRSCGHDIAEIAIKDQDGYNKEYLPLITKALTDAGGKFVVRGGKTISFEGAPPAPRVVVIQFESLEKLQALYESAPYKQAEAIGDKYATQRIFGVEGVLP